MENTKFVVESAVLFAQSEIDARDALELMAKAMGTAPTFDLWEKNRAEWQTAYCAKRAQVDGGAVAWSRLTSRLAAEFGLVKPKASSKDAVRKQESAKDAKAKAADALAAALQAAGAVQQGEVMVCTPEQEKTALASLAGLVAEGNKSASKAIELLASQKIAADKAADKALRDDVAKKVKGANNLALRMSRAVIEGDIEPLATATVAEWPALAESVIGHMEKTRLAAFILENLPEVASMIAASVTKQAKPASRKK